MTREDPERQKEYDRALADAVDHVSHTVEAQAEGERQALRSWLPGLTVTLVAFTLVAAWNAWLLMRPPPTLPADVVEAGLRYEVGLLVREIEAYRAEYGVLPAPLQLTPFLDDIVSYTVSGDAYVVSARHGEVRLDYDGSVPLELWVAGEVTP